jgi:hypothetical protein
MECCRKSGGETCPRHLSNSTPQRRAEEQHECTGLAFWGVGEDIVTDVSNVDDHVESISERKHIRSVLNLFDLHSNGVAPVMAADTIVGRISAHFIYSSRYPTGIR